ncbi:RNA polymerase sigma factor FliA [Aromatoleum diolicum]|uniref:RNA polymerase sigma factor FliA n=1 Tax=Aromatoleum diolicum TaxID=75796 RepID=A0ABX1QHY9_9RHOO|nr:RNA polymerase sigma factor FliA [Aromatoleum diolicum]NMG76720.1 FliA/WhiG family RNA polymerase sigma factor [Aromatoleum diolicum]
MYDAEGNLDKSHLVEAYAPLVKRIAYHLMAKLPASVQMDDLIQNGMLGLLDAIGRYEDGLGAQFETYAVQRIRGAMLDGLRENDWLPRSMRRDMRRIESAIHSLEQQHGRQPTEIELAASLEMPLADYQRMLQDARGYQLVHFEDFTDGEGEDYFERHLGEHESNPLDLLEAADMRSTLVRAIEDLPEREKLMMALYYDEELNLREIGEVLGVSESRVCQLHSQAVARLRSRIAGGAAKGSGTGARRGRPPKVPASDA